MDAPTARNENMESENKEATAAAPSKPQKVHVFLLLGQSNMLGMGKVQGRDKEGSLEYAVHTKHKYPYLINHGDTEDEDDDDAVDAPQTDWATDPRVRCVSIMGSGGAASAGKLLHNEWMTAQGHKTIGPELGIGHVLSKYYHSKTRTKEDNHSTTSHKENDPKDEDKKDHDADSSKILLLKSCIGNRSLGWDLLPPGSPSYDYTDPKTDQVWTYAGYGDSPARWPQGTDPVPAPSWQAGLQYDGDIARVKHVLQNLAPTYWPDRDDDDGRVVVEYEVAGSFFWQGDKDRYDRAHALHYHDHLLQLVEQLRVEFDAPYAKFVCATLGQTSIEESKKETISNEGLILQAQLAVGDDDEQAACVYSKPLCGGPGASNSHYNGNAETYMNVGEALGYEMLRLLDASVVPSIAPATSESDDRHTGDTITKKKTSKDNSSEWVLVDPDRVV